MTKLTLPDGATYSTISEISFTDVASLSSFLPQFETILTERLGYHAVHPDVRDALYGVSAYIEPEFTVKENIEAGLMFETEALNGVRTSNNWSGSVVSNVNKESYVFSQIVGYWTNPTVQSPESEGKEYCACWIGMDGSGDDDKEGQNHDVLQAGTGVVTINDGTSAKTEYSCWTGWWPSHLVTNNLPVDAGDSIVCLIVALSSTRAIIFLRNSTQGVMTAFEMTPPTGKSLAGKNAEFIVERPRVGQILSKLANYGSVTFSGSAIARNADDDTISVDVAQGMRIDMVERGTVISSARLDPADETCTCMFDN